MDQPWVKCTRQSLPFSGKHMPHTSHPLPFCIGVVRVLYQGPSCILEWGAAPYIWITSVKVIKGPRLSLNVWSDYCRIWSSPQLPSVFQQRQPCSVSRGRRRNFSRVWIESGFSHWEEVWTSQNLLCKVSPPPFCRPKGQWGGPFYVTAHTAVCGCEGVRMFVSHPRRWLFQGSLSLHGLRGALGTGSVCGRQPSGSGTACLPFWLKLPLMYQYLYVLQMGAG